MVHIQPPPGWNPPKEEVPPGSVSSAPDLSKTPPPPKSGVIARPAAPVPPPVSPTLPSVEEGLDGSCEVVPPPLPGLPPSPPLPLIGREEPEQPADEIVAPPRQTGGWMARHRILLAGAPLGAVALGVAVWIVAASRPAERPAGPTSEQVQMPVTADPNAAETKPLPELNLPWTPNGTKLVASLQVSQLLAMPDADRFVERVGPTWSKTVARVVQGFGLNPRMVRRMTWACTDLAAWPDQSVVVVELEANQDANLLTAASKPVDLVLGKSKCYGRPESSWPHPFAVINAQTIVTGNEPLLRHLADRDKLTLESKSIERLLKTMSGDPLVGLQIDLDAARSIHGRVPEQWLDVWPDGRQAWRAAWENSAGFGFVLNPAEPWQTALFFACSNAKTAGQVRPAIEELLSQIRATITARLESLGSEEDAAAKPYSTVLEEILAAIASFRMELAGETVCVRFSGRQKLSPLVKAGLEGEVAALADWLAGALGVDRSQHGRLLGAMNEYHKAQGHYPAGDVGEGKLPAETRLSWIATMLPHLGHDDWHKQLEFAYSWNGEKNGQVTRRVLPEAVNPALGPGLHDGYPVTHYVGVAGVGVDAANLKADDPRAGVFGHGRAANVEDIADGASNTIAILGVTGQTGAWAAGGPSTVRSLTTAPYVNGPDGFGSGQRDGMLAGMADGAVRFISKDVDPRVLEQLATIRGRENVTVAELDRKSESVTSSSQQPAKSEPKDMPKSEAKDVPTPAEPKPSAPPREPLPATNIERFLAQRLPEIQLRDTSLIHFVQMVGELSGQAITIDPDALVRLGVTLADPITVELDNATTCEILAKGVAPRGLALAVSENGVVVTSPKAEREKLKEVRYRVDDLAPSDPQQVARLAALTAELVAPDTWKTAGGKGSVSADGDALKVDQTGVVHAQVVAFYERLRQARKLPPVNPSDASRFSLATRTDLAATTLGRRVPVSFSKPTPLAHILAALEKRGQATILVDWAQLRSEQISPQTLATIKAHDLPLTAALDSLLQPLGLGYRVVDGKLLQVTTGKAIAQRWELEFYPAANLVKRLTGPALLARLKASVGKESWKEAGGLASAVIDEPSGYLLVVQSQPIQAAIGQLLKEIAAEKRP